MNEFKIVGGKLKLRRFPYIQIMGRTGAPLKLSIIANRGRLTAIRDGLGFPNYVHKAQPDLTARQT